MLSLRFPLALAMITLASAHVGCAASPSAAPKSAPTAASTAAATAASAIKRPGEAAIGDRTSCPVAHEEFTVTESSPKTVFEGKTYYFCCPPCAQEFAANPAKFLKP